MNAVTQVLNLSTASPAIRSLGILQLCINRGCKNNEESKYCDSKWIEESQHEEKPSAVNKTKSLAIQRGHHSKNKVKVQKGQKEDIILVKEEFSDSDVTVKEELANANSCSGQVSGANIKDESKEIMFDFDIKEEFDDSIFDILLP